MSIQCHYRRHLRGARLSIYEYALAMSQSSGEFYASLRRSSLETGYCVRALESAIRGLRRAGWFHPISTDGGRVNGRFQANRYRVATHAEWADIHTGACERLNQWQKLPQAEIATGRNCGLPVAVSSNCHRQKLPPILVVKQEEREQEPSNCQRRSSAAESLASPEEIQRQWAKEEALSQFPLPEAVERALETVCDFAASLWDSLIALSDDDGVLAWGGNVQVISWGLPDDRSLYLTDDEREELSRAGLIKLLPNKGLPAELLDRYAPASHWVKVQVVPFEGWQQYKALLVDAKPDYIRWRQMLHPSSDKQ